jgi:hypothetical protein
MYNELYPIFYPYKKMDTKDKIMELKKYMFKPMQPPSLIIESISPLVQPLVSASPSSSALPLAPSPITKTTLYYPDKQNSLFWSIFIFIHGYDEYQTIQPSKHPTVVLTENQKIIESIKSNPKILKTTNHKITNAKTKEIMSDLMVGINGNNLSLLLAYSVYYKISIVVFIGHLYFTVNPEGDGDQEEGSCNQSKTIYLFYDETKRRYGFDIAPPSTIDDYFLLENYNKALKAVSHYKLTDLCEIAQTLKIEYDPKLKKNELYSLLENKFLVLLKDWLIESK